MFLFPRQGDWITHGETLCHDSHAKDQTRLGFLTNVASSSFHVLTNLVSSRTSSFNNCYQAHESMSNNNHTQSVNIPSAFKLAAFPLIRNQAMQK